MTYVEINVKIIGVSLTASLLALAETNRLLIDNCLTNFDVLPMLVFGMIPCHCLHNAIRISHSIIAAIG